MRVRRPEIVNISHFYVLSDERESVSESATLFMSIFCIEAHLPHRGQPYLVLELNVITKKVSIFTQTNETPVPASIKVDVSDVARNVASMGRLLRAGWICISRITTTLPGWKMEV